MKERVSEQPLAANPLKLHAKVSVLCTVLLFCAYVFSASFYPQLLIFLFLLFSARKVLKDGFDALVSFLPDSRSLVTLCVFSALLHGVSAVEEKNCFFYAALTLTLAEISELLSEKHFQGRRASRNVADRISNAAVIIALVLLVAAVIVNLAAGNGIFTVMKRAFTVFVFACPCIAAFADVFFGVLSAEVCIKHGALNKGYDTFEKLGRTKEIIIEQSGIVTEKKYSLYDVYSTDGDKVRLLSVVAAIEQHFTHPYAEAVMSAARSIGAIGAHAENCYEICSKGVCATVDGDKYLLGSKRLLRDKKVNIPDAVSKIDFGMYMPIYVARNSEFCGVLLLCSKMTSGAAQALDMIGELGLRRILLSDGERADLKNHVDILLCEREKVLQEFKKGVKIKAMTVTGKKIANADVVVLTSDCDEADIIVDAPVLQNLLRALLICRRSFAFFKAALVASMTVALIFAAMAAFGIAFLPMAAAFASVLPLAFCIGVQSPELPQFTALEEDEMFGKINYTMKINGMSCAHCSARVKTALESLRGVSAEVSLEEKTARIKCPASTTAEVLAKAVSDVGFTVVSTERV